MSNDIVSPEHREAQVAELEASIERLLNDLDAAQDEIERLRADADLALGEATRLLESFVAEHFPPNPDWRPLPDLIGVLSQLSNASTIARDYKAEIERLRTAECNYQAAHDLQHAEIERLLAALREIADNINCERGPSYRARAALEGK